MGGGEEPCHRRHGMCITIECSYKLDQKMNLNFCVNYAHFCKSGHIYYECVFNIAVKVSSVTICLDK